MTVKVINGITIDVNDEGYMINSSQWTKEIAVELAMEAGITLSDKHFQVLEFIRNAHAKGEVLTIRKVGNSGVVTIKELYELFPGGPLKLSSKFAGIPKPTSCV